MLQLQIGTQGLLHGPTSLNIQVASPMSVRARFASSLLTASLLWLNCAPAHAQPAEAPAPSNRGAFVFPRVILNNDNTGWDNLYLDAETRKGTTAEINQAVRSAFKRYMALGDLRSVDAQSLSVNYSTFPAWGKSRLYTFADHDRFLRTLPYYKDPEPKTSGYPGQTPSSARTYITSGNDLVEDFLQQRRQGEKSGPPDQLKILAFRLNDHHFTWNYPLYSTRTKRSILSAASDNRDPFCQRNGKGAANVESNEYWAQMSFNGISSAFETGVLDPQLDGRCVQGLCLSAADIRSQCKNGQGCVIAPPSGAGQCDVITLNFAAASVRNFKLMQMAEIVQNYRPPVLEIDFDRYPQHFEASLNTAQRISIMTAFLQQVRDRLLKIEPNLRIGLRVPSRKLHRENVGIDLSLIDQQRLADYFILAMPAAADQQIQYQINPYTAHAKVYAEMFEEISRFPRSIASFSDFAGLTARGFSLNAQIYPADTRALATATHLAHSRHHVQGMAIFNSQYYQYHIVDSGGQKRHTQPDSGIECLGNPVNAARNDQHYLLTHTHYGLQQACDLKNMFGSVCDQLPFPKSALASGHRFQMEMAKPAQGWKQDAGLLRLTFLAYPGGEQAQPATPNDYAGIAAGLNVTINGVKLKPADPTSSIPPDPIDGPTANAYYKSMWWTAPVFNKLLQVDPSTLLEGQNDVAISFRAAVGASAPNFRIVNFDMFLPAGATAGVEQKSCAAL